MRNQRGLVLGALAPAQHPPSLSHAHTHVSHVITGCHQTRFAGRPGRVALPPVPGVNTGDAFCFSCLWVVIDPPLPPYTTQHSSPLSLKSRLSCSQLCMWRSRYVSRSLPVSPNRLKSFPRMLSWSSLAPVKLSLTRVYVHLLDEDHCR